MAMTNEGCFVQLLRQQAGDMALEQNRREIQRAIDRAKRTEADKEFTRQFFRCEARSRWSADRWRRYREWLRKQEEEDHNSPRGEDEEHRRLCREDERRVGQDRWPSGPMRRDGGRRKWRPK